MSYVPCNGCTQCCTADAIRMLPGDDVSSYKTVQHEHYPGSLMLDHKENGECVYQGPEGCLIHDRRPRMCRDMDCRNIAKKVPKAQAKRMGILRVWLKGRSMA